MARSVDIGAPVWVAQPADLSEAFVSGTVKSVGSDGTCVVDVGGTERTIKQGGLMLANPVRRPHLRNVARRGRPPSLAYPL